MLQIHTDWLSVGRSFVTSEKQGPEASSSSSTALQTLSKRRKRNDKKSSKKSRKGSRRGDSESDSSGEDAESRRRRHKQQRKLKRLRESDSRHSSRSASPQHNKLVAAAPKEVQAWINHQQVGNLDVAGGKLFEFDCVGDRENYFYGTLYAQDKPLYALATRRNLLTGEWITDAKTSNEAASRPGTTSDLDAVHADRYFGASARQGERDARQTRLFLAYSEKRLARQRERDGAAAAELAFIPLDPVLDSSSSVESDELVMRTETANVEQYLVTQSKAFNESLQKNPHDIARWLDYAAFQEQSARLARRKSGSRSSAEMVMEKQDTILDKAIQENPESRALRLAKLNLSMQRREQSDSHRTANDIDALRRLLEEMIESDPTNSELWGKLILARQQNFASFSVPSLRDLYARVIGVLRKEVVKVVQQEVRESSSSSASASRGPVQIFDANSLLATDNSAPPSYTSVLSSSKRANELVRLLLAFHMMTCRLEVAAGYTERSIAQLQALLDFNVASSSSATTSPVNTTLEQLHSDMQREFASRWSQHLPHFGDDFDSSMSLVTAFVPSSTAFAKHVQARLMSPLTSMNPPDAIRSPDHQQRLLRLAAGSLYKSRHSMDALNGRETGEMSSADKRDELVTSGLTYSNVHGYRIKIDEIDDASEYERILGELRGTDASIARQESQSKKKEKQQTSAAKSVARFHDERVDYDQVDEQDEYVQWLHQEELKERTQWIPLRLTNPHHQELIDESPDRAVLTEEIQPFLFLVPRSLHLSITLNLLECVGVRWTKSSADHPEALNDVYADGFEEFDDLVAPILRAMDPTSTESIALSIRGRRNMLQRELLDDIRVNADMLIDPSKVAFARNVLLRFIDVVHREGDREYEQLVKYLWIELEAHIIRASEGERTESLQHARELCQKLMERDEKYRPSTSSPSADIALMFAYAKLELRVGNFRQVNRICDKTIESLALHASGDTKMDRSFHCLLFLRARNEMWSGQTSEDPRNVQDDELRKLMTLYVLWSCWQRDWEPLDSLTKKFRKQPRKLRKHLESVLTTDVRTAVIEKYRVELEIAVQQHSKRANRDFGASLRQSDWFWCVGYCVHNLCLAVYAVAGYHAACSEYQALIRDVCESGSRIDDHQACWLLLCYLEFIQQHQLEYAFPIVAPREWRQAVGNAVERLPHDPVLLRLFVDAETSNTMSQSLRRHFHQAQQRWQRQFDSPLLVEWLFALLCEFGRLERFASHAAATLSESGAQMSSLPPQATCCLLHKYESNVVGLERVRRLFQDMVESVRTQGNALCWRLYVRFEERLGKVEAARRVFYRGLAKCPWSKALYLDGVRVLRPYLSEGECKELVDFMSAKELHLREDM